MDLDTLMTTLTDSFSGRFIEVSIISRELNLRELLFIESIITRSGYIFFKTDNRYQVSLKISEITTFYLYGPLSLVFITNTGTTITLRQESSLTRTHK